MGRQGLGGEEMAASLRWGMPSQEEEASAARGNRREMCEEIGRREGGGNHVFAEAWAALVLG